MWVTPPPSILPVAAPASRPTDDGVDARTGLGAMSFGAGGAAGLISVDGAAAPGSGFSAAAFRFCLPPLDGVVVVASFFPSTAGA